MNIRPTILLAMVVVVWSASVVAALPTGLGYVYGTPPAVEFELPGLDGTTYRLSGLRGKVLLVNFWATWCPPCLEEMPAIQQAWSTLHGDDFEVLGVNVSEDEETVKRFLAEFTPALEFPILLDQSMAVFNEWSIRVLPTTYIIDKQGRIIYTAQGPRDMNSEHIQQRLQKLIDE